MTTLFLQNNSTQCDSTAQRVALLMRGGRV